MTDLVLVTGGAGFIGSHLVHALLARGDRVRVLDDLSTGSRDNLPSLTDHLEFLEGDIRDADVCRRAAEGCTYAFHEAALPSVPRSVDDPATSHAVNATGTLNVLNACRDAGVKRVVYASSSSVYGPDPKQPREETDRPQPISPYAVAKLAGEHYCAAFFRSYGLETVALRYFNVFGPRQRADSPYAAVLPRFVKRLRLGEPVTIFGDGEQGRDFTYIENVVAVNLLALTARAARGRFYNVGGGARTTVNRMLALTAAALGVEARAEYQPPRTGDVRDSLAAIALAQADLGYSPSVGVEEGVRRTVAWAVQQAP